MNRIYNLLRLIRSSADLFPIEWLLLAVLAAACHVRQASAPPSKDMYAELRSTALIFVSHPEGESIKGRWSNEPGCKSPVANRNTVSIECREGECEEHIAVVFGPGDSVGSAWHGMMMILSDEYEVQRRGKVIGGKVRGSGVPKFIEIDLERQTATKTIGGERPCTMYLR